MIKYLLVWTLVVGFAPSMPAQEPAKKGARVDPETAMVNQFIKQLEPAGLDQETTSKIREIFAKTAKEVVSQRKAVELTPEMLKNRAEASKKAREEGKKPKEVRDIGLEALKGTDAQKKALIETEEMLAKARVEVGKLLTEDQKSKLPKQLQANLKEPAPKKNAKP